jgi:hypothetical protein
VPKEIKPVTLLTLSNSDLYGLDVTTAGWGVSNTGSSAIGLEAVNLKILTNTECEERTNEILGYKLDMDIGIICTAIEPFALLQHVSK